MPDRHCESCGTPLTSPSPRARFCGPTCRSRAHRAGQSAPAAAVDIATRRPAEPDTEHPMVTRARERLRAAERLDTWEGQAALDLAEQIAASKVATLSARAAANKQLGEAMDRALRGADAAGSRVQEIQDEMAKRRERRAAQAAQ